MSPEPLDLRSEHPEIDSVAGYSPVSRLAVLALVLAIFACGAVVSPLMVCFAVAAVLVAVAALWSIARAPRPPLGRKVAIAALLLGVLFGVWGTTWRLVREQVVYVQAQQRADQWLQLVRTGRLQEAHQLHLAHESRQAPGADLKEYYKNDREARFEVESYFRAEPLRQIIEAGERGSLRFLQGDNLLDETYSGQKTDLVTLRYALDSPEKDPSKTLVFLVTMARKVASGGAEAYWELRGVQLPKK
jgi:hypothetical protein